MGPEIDLSPDQFAREIPFESFARLRSEAPLYWYEPDGYWVVSNHDLVGEVNRNPAVFSSWGGPVGAGTSLKPRSQPLGDGMLIQMDPPEHTAYRRLVASAFTPRSVGARRVTVERLARELVEEFLANGGGDWSRSVATLLPFRVISGLLGIPRGDEEEVLVRVMAQPVGADPDGNVDRSALQERNNEYADWLVEEHRRYPRGDLIDQLIDARIDGRPLTQNEMRAWVTMYISGGADTTRHLIANGLVCLLSTEEAKQKVMAGADMALVVEEMLRFVAPVMHHSRWPLEDIEIRGQLIRKGQRTTLWMISANRDSSVFEDPDRFDVDRDPNRHDSLGAGGPHFCLGAGLARLEARVLFQELRPHLPRLQLAGNPVRGRNNFLNVLTSCPVAVLA